VSLNALWKRLFPHLSPKEAHAEIMKIKCIRCNNTADMVDIHPVHKVCDECWRSTTKNPFSRR